MAIQDITLVVKTKVDQLNKLEKSIDTVEKKIGKVSKKVIVLDTSKAVRNVEKLNDSLEKASKFVRRFSKEAKGFTGVRAISNELGMMNQQLAQARKALNDTSKAIADEKERLGKLSDTQKQNIRTTQQQNAALSILAITYKKLRIENDAFVAAQTRAFQKQGGGENSITGGDTFGSIKKRIDAFKKWPETLDASARALQEVNYLLNLAVKDSEAFNLLAKTKIELELKESKILEAITGEKKEQTDENKKQVDSLEQQNKAADKLAKKLKQRSQDFKDIGSQIKNIFSGFGLGTQWGSSAALFGGGMLSSGIGSLMGGIGLGGTGIAKSFSGLGKTTNILASVDAIGKLAIGAQGLALAADQAARSVFSVGKALTNFVTKGFISKWESSYFQKFLRSGMQDLDITRASQKPQLSNFDGQLQNYLNDVQASLSGLDTPMRRQAPKTGPSRFASIDARASGLSWFEMLFPGNIKEIFTGMSMMGGSPFAAAQDMGVDAQKWDQYNKDLANDRKFTDLVNQEIKLKREILNLEKARANAIKKITNAHKTEAEKQQEMLQRFDASMKATKTRVQAASPGSMIGGRQMPSPYGLGRGDMVPTATEKAIRRQNEQRMKQARISGKILGNDIKLLDNHGKIIDKQAQSAKISEKLFSTSQRRNRSLRARLKLMGKQMGMSSNTKDLESMMLGAGFPLLFGGGVGSIGGSIAGSGLASMFGVSGFGAQIFGSAIGQMLETAVVKASELGKALSTLSMDGLQESGIRFTAELENQVNLLRKAGEIEQARALINQQVQSQIGASSDSLEDVNGAVNILKAAWDDVVGAAGAFLGIVSAPLLVALGAILKIVAMIFAWTNKGFSQARKLLTALTGIVPGLNEAVKGFTDRFNPALQESILKAKELGDEMRRNAALLRFEGEVRAGLPIGNTFEDQRERARGNNLIALTKFDQKTETERRQKRKESFFFDEGAFNEQKVAERGLVVLSLSKELDKINLKETKLLESLDRQVENLNVQNKITEKINAAKKTGDKSLVIRLQGESELVAIQQKLREDLLAANTIEEELLLVKKAIADQDKIRLKTAGTLIAKSKELSSEEQKLKAVYASIGTSIRDGLVESINAAIDGTKTLGEVASNVFRRISNALMTYGIDMALMGLTGGTEGFFGQALGYGKRAAGGPVTGGRPYVVGEKGPELFVPGSSGNIVPNHEMGGSNIVVNVDASGSEVEGNEGQAAELGRMLGAAIQAELIREKRPGGLLAGTR